MELWKALKRRRLAMAGGAVIVVLVVLGIAGPWIAPYDPLDQDLAQSIRAVVGTLVVPTLRRDILSRVLFGARISLLVGIVSQGSRSRSASRWLVSGYYGGKSMR